ncbi:pyocin knob domain-containing protein [Paenibacillus amylolyticus]|uniref:pyocin knob domain-containing protein n=1 Tax=Paenibacillus amylolyticus TaxID=1451 RepID=UPI003EB9C5EF
MSEPKTPNLGLNKIDRSSPSTTYFDLDRYLDQNWEKVDDFAKLVGEKVEETATKVSDIEERLDVEKRRSVTLKPGLQIIHAERASTFKLEGLKGRTLVNLLGRDGGFESMNGWFTTAGVASELDSSQKTQGNQSIKISLKEGSTGGSLYKLLGQTLSTSKNYIALADLKKDTSTSVSLSLWNGTSNVSGTVVTTDQFSTAVLLIPATSLGTTTNNLQISIVGSVKGQFGHVDAVRLYEITSDELNALSNMPANKIAAKYPHVDSVQPVHNPFVIRYGENLLPPFYEWNSLGHSLMIDAPYSASGKMLADSIGTDAYAVTYLNILADQEYTISNPLKSTGKLRLSVYATSERVQGVFINPGETKTIRTAPNAVYIGMHLSGVTQYTDEFDVSKWTWSAGNKATFVQPVMTLGEAARSFKVREDSMLALQTDLYSDPVTGEDADEIFFREGHYYKVRKWGKVQLIPENLDSNSLGATKYTGYKQIAIYMPRNVDTSNFKAYLTKYNGKNLTLDRSSSPLLSADVFNVGNDSYKGYLWMTVSNDESGWGDSYNPTADDIKAYFLGWRLYDGESSLYNGVGTKYWHKLSDGISTPGQGTKILPTTQIPGWTPYQLVYLVSKPIIDPIKEEGQLTFLEGHNQLEVGSTLEIRESVNPVFTSNEYKSYNINNFNQSSKLKKKVKKIMSIYKDDMQDYWDVNRFSPESEIYGRELASLPAFQFDSSAKYSVTYQSLGDFFSVPLTGTVGENEKSVIDQLINDSSAISKKLSVFEGKDRYGELKNFVNENYLSKASSINESEDLNNYLKEGEFYCQFNSAAQTLKNCPVVEAFSLKVSKNGAKNTGNIPGVTQTLITFLTVGFTTWQRNLYDTWGAWVQVPSREEFESLKSSVSDGKSAIAAAITGKGVTASGSDTFAQLATKVVQVSEGRYQSIVPSISPTSGTVNKGQTGTVTTLATFQKGTKIVSIGSINESWIPHIFSGSSNLNVGFGFKDGAGKLWYHPDYAEGGVSGRTYFNLLHMECDFVTGILSSQYFKSDSPISAKETLSWKFAQSIMPSDFNIQSGPISLVVCVSYNNVFSSGGYQYRFQNSRILSI